MKKAILLGLCMVLLLPLVARAEDLQWRPISNLTSVVNVSHEDAGLPKENGVDGVKSNLGAEWRYGTGNTGANPTWFIVDIGTTLRCPKRMEIISNVAPDHLRMWKYYNITVSENNLTWTRITPTWQEQVTQPTGDYSNYTVIFPSGYNARFVRLYSSEAYGAGNEIVISEITYFEPARGNESCGELPQPPGSNMNTTITFPVNETAFTVATLPGNNSRIWINGTHNQTTGTTCGINDSRFTSNGANLDMGLNFTYYNNTAIPEGQTTVYVQCNLTGSANATAETTFAIDYTLPVITSSFGKYTIALLRNKLENLTASINLSDNHLYSLRINDSVGGLIFEKTNIEGTTYEYNLSVNMSNRTIGANTITIRYSDAHTARRIPVWEYDKNELSRDVSFDFNRGSYVNIVPENIGMFDDFDVQENFDRYNFLYYNNLRGQTELTFRVQSSHPIDLINKENAEYKAWMVIPALDKWIDFNLQNPTGKEVYEVTRLAANDIRVRITNLDGRAVYNFNSIGETNVVTQTYTWYLVNATETYTTRYLENVTYDYTLNITKGGAAVSTNAEFFYQGNRVTPTKSSSAHSDLYYVRQRQDAVTSFTKPAYFNWTYNATGNGSYGKYSANHSDIIYKMDVGNCNGTYNETGLNFTIIDETNNNHIFGADMEGTVTIWSLRDANNSRVATFNNDTMASSHKDICFYPWFANYTASYNLLFQKDGFNDVTRTENNVYMNSSTQEETIYMFPTNVTTAVTVIIVNELEDELSGYTVEIHKYNPSGDNFTFVDMGVTGSTGKVIFNVDVSTYDYKFIVKDNNGTTVYEEPKQKLVETTYTFQIYEGIAPEFINTQIYGLDISLTADKPTKTFTLTWTDIGYAASQIKLLVTRDNATANTTTLYTNTSTAGTGVMTYVIAEDTRNRSVSYLARAYITSVEDSNEYSVASATIDYLKEWDIFGEESLFMAFLLVGTLIFIGAAVSPGLAAIMAGFGMIITWMMGLYILSFSSLIGLLVILILVWVKVRNR